MLGEEVGARDEDSVILQLPIVPANAEAAASHGLCCWTSCWEKYDGWDVSNSSWTKK